MLVLTRKLGESIVITDKSTDVDNELSILIVEIRNSQVKLAIKAPLRYIVDRKEVHERKQR